MLQEIMSEGNENHYQDNRVAGRDSDEVGTRDGLWTNQLKLGLMASSTGKPLMEALLDIANFSETKPSVVSLSSNSDASQPCSSRWNHRYTFSE
jgi:hypothetical protein